MKAVVLQEIDEIVEARSGGTRLVRLVASGFLSEADWQAEYDSTAEGLQLFLTNPGL